jgi:hypothetical protein
MKRAEKITSEHNMLKKEKYRPLKSSTEPLSKADKHFPLHAIKDEETEPKKKVPLIKRFSPFLMLVCLLLVLFPYMMITGNGNIKSFWLLLFLFPFSVSNILFADIAIWKYFEGKKIMPIWLTELALSILIVQLLI